MGAMGPMGPMGPPGPPWAPLGPLGSPGPRLDGRMLLGWPGGCCSAGRAETNTHTHTHTHTRYVCSLHLRGMNTARAFVGGRML